MKDGIGFIGSVLQYTFLIALFGSTFLTFFYLWRKGRLDLDEEAKLQMMEEDHEPR